MSKFHGRREPYTERGIHRVPCVRCGEPSVHQWQICANANRYLTVCEACDIELNRIALDFARIPNAKELMARYEGRPR